MASEAETHLPSYPPKQNGHDFCIFVAVNTYWEVNTNRSETEVVKVMETSPHMFSGGCNLEVPILECQTNWGRLEKGVSGTPENPSCVALWMWNKPARIKQNKSWNVRCHSTKSCFTLRSLFLVKICLKKTAVGMLSFFFFRNGKSWSGWPGRSIHDHRLT